MDIFCFRCAKCFLALWTVGVKQAEALVELLHNLFSYTIPTRSLVQACALQRDCLDEACLVALLLMHAQHDP